MMPFITEEIWQMMRGNSRPAPTIALAEFPKPGSLKSDAEAERQMNLLQLVVTEIRSLRAEWRVRSDVQLHVLFAGRDSANNDLRTHETALRALAKVQNIEFVERLPASGLGRASKPAYDLQIDLRGAIDIDAERARLTREQESISRSRENIVRQLANETFRTRAPEKVVAEMQQRQAELTRQLEQIKHSLAALE
jgi:valyl-tRNA synthetase